MENQEQANKEKQQNNSLPSSQKKSESVSKAVPYLGKLTQQGITNGTLAIKAAFPGFPISSLNALIDDFIEVGFTDAEMEKAIKHVRRTCKYPFPQIAEFVNYDGLYAEREKTPKPSTPEEVEARRLKREERDRLEKEKDDKFFAMIMQDSPKMPEGFEDFEPCDGK